MSRHKFRFKVEIDGQVKRSSGIWNLWIGGKGSDIYLAPRPIAGDMKLSVHRNSEQKIVNQLGLYGKGILERLRASDSHVFYRWDSPDAERGAVQGSNRVVTAVFFAHDELAAMGEQDKLPGGTVIRFPRGCKVVGIFVFETGPSFDEKNLMPETESSGILFRYTKQAGGEVIVAWDAQQSLPDNWLAGLTSGLSDWRWNSPRVNAKYSDFGFTFHRANSVPIFSEFDGNKHKPSNELPDHPDLEAVVVGWNWAPEFYREQDVFCAYLICAPKGAFLCVDPRSRCSHNHLVADANSLIGKYRSNKATKNWDHFSGGVKGTAILTPNNADQQGIMGGSKI